MPQSRSVLITFAAETATRAAPRAVLDLLRAPGEHLEWAGARSPQTTFRLLDLESDGAVASVGTTFRSTGAAANGTFHDSSVVTVVDGSAFAFRTTSRLDRRHGSELRLTFDHRYDVRPAEDGSHIAYTCTARDANYVPYWLWPVMRPVTRRMIQRLMTRQLRLLADLAEERSASGLSLP